MKVLQKIILIVFLTGIVCLSACKTTEEAAVDEVTPKEIYYDIEAVKVDLSSSYSAISRQYDPEPFIKLQEEVMAGKVNQTETIYRLQQILTDYNILHLSINPLRSDAAAEKAPFVFYCYGSSYYVTAADKKYSKYLGWKLTGIGKYSISEAVNKLGEFVPSETPAGKKYILNRLIYFEDYFYYGLTDNGKITFTFELEDGKTKVIKAKPVTSKNAIFTYISPKAQTPFTCYYLTKTNYEVIDVPETATLYLQYMRFIEMENYRLTDLFNDITNKLQSETYSPIVIDLRYNTGGRYNPIHQTLLAANKEELEKYNIAIVTTGRTASASCQFINDILSTFPHVKIFGEETGQAVFNYTGTWPQVLKKLNCTFEYPTQIDNVPKLVERSTDTSRGIIPDVEVLEDFASTLNGEDAIYKAIYEYYNK